MNLLDIFAAIANIATSIGVLFAGYTYFHDARRLRKQDTLLAYQNLQRETLSKLNKWLPSEIRKASEDRTCVGYKELSGYLAEVEHFCVGLNEGIYDFETFYKLAHGYFDDSRGMLKNRLIPLLEVKLQYSKEDYFANLHEVWEKMEERKGADKEKDLRCSS